MWGEKGGDKLPMSAIIPASGLAVVWVILGKSDFSFLSLFKNAAHLPVAADKI